MQDNNADALPTWRGSSQPNLKWWGGGITAFSSRLNTCIVLLECFLCRLLFSEDYDFCVRFSRGTCSEDWERSHPSTLVLDPILLPVHDNGTVPRPWSRSIIPIED